MCQIWEAVFETSPVRPDDDYFALGGESLQAIEILTEVQKVFGVRLPMSSLFAAPTPANWRPWPMRGESTPTHFSAGPVKPRGAGAAAIPVARGRRQRIRLRQTLAGRRPRAADLWVSAPRGGFRRSHLVESGGGRGPVCSKPHCGPARRALLHRGYSLGDGWRTRSPGSSMQPAARSVPRSD